MAEYLILHIYHLFPFNALMVIGGLLFIYMPIHCTERAGIPIIWPQDFKRLNDNECKVLILGILAFLVGLIGHSIVKEKYGIYTKVTDENGYVEFYHSESWIKYERQRQ